MTAGRSRMGPIGYRIRVEGHLDAHWSPWFAGLTVTPEGDGTTSLIGVVADQAQLHGVLAKIRDLGVGLLLVQVYDPTTDAAKIAASS